MNGPEIKKIAIVGAGIAGARLASLLASRGLDVSLFDHKAPWEKPCGGGLTAKLFEDFPDVKTLNFEDRKNYDIEIVTPFGRRSRLLLEKPIITVSRKDIARTLIEEAVKAGVEFRKERVISIKDIDNGIIIHTKDNENAADFIVGADGIGSIVRKHYAEPFSPSDRCLTYGALLPGNLDIPIIIRFFKNRSGYAWVFPRKDETSIGIIFGDSPGRDVMLGELQDMVNTEWRRIGAEPPVIERPYAKHVPSMTISSFNNPILCGNNWALIGDASGAVDPLTGEGIYYAFRTAGILSDAVISNDVGHYSEEWIKMASASIGKAGKGIDRFYDQRTLRMIGIMMDYSMSFKRMIGDVMAGCQGYDNLKQRIKNEGFKYISEVIVNLLKIKKSY